MSATIDDQIMAELLGGDAGVVDTVRRQLAQSSDDVVLEQVVAAAAAGSPTCLDLVLETIERQKLTDSAIRRYMFDADLVDDVRQETLIAVGRTIHQFRGDAAFRTWLHRVATNTAIGHLRRRRTHEPLDETEGVHAKYVSSMIASRETLRDAIDSLPESQRIALTMRDIEGFSYAEVAESMGLNLNTVKSHIARGRAAVAASFRGDRGL